MRKNLLKITAGSNIYNNLKIHVMLYYLLIIIIIAVVCVLLFNFINATSNNSTLSNTTNNNDNTKTLNTSPIHIVEKWSPYTKTTYGEISTGDDPQNFYNKPIYKQPYNYPYKFHTDNPMPYMRHNEV